jgi:hypothetical protein
MPIPSNKQEDEAELKSGHLGDNTVASNSGELGANGPRASHFQISAGAAHSAPQQGSIERGLELLQEALASLSTETPAAAGVYSRMRKIDPSFTFHVAGYKSFRELLNEAEKQGLVTIEKEPGASDVMVRPALGGSMPKASKPVTRIGTDLWRALLDWGPSANYGFDRDSGRTNPLEDGKLSTSQVRVPSISKAEQLEWMREFAAQETSEIAQAALNAGLAQSDPTAGFSQALKQSDPASRRWKRFLKLRVLDRATKWAGASSIPLSSIEGANPSAKLSRLPSESPSSPNTEDTESLLREHILSVVASLPLSELLRISIPVEYTIRR